MIMIMIPLCVGDCSSFSLGLDVGDHRDQSRISVMAAATAQSDRFVVDLQKARTPIRSDLCRGWKCPKKTGQDLNVCGVKALPVPYILG